MKARFLPILLLLTVFFVNVEKINAKDKKNKFIGEWVYEVSDAPVEYKTGTIIFSTKDAETVCVIKLEAGELAASNVKIEEDKVTFVAYVDGSPVNVELTMNEDKLSGTVESPEGPKEITAVRKK